MGKLYAIAVITDPYLRDYKLKKLQGLEDEPSWDQLLRVKNLAYHQISIQNNNSYSCRFTDKICRTNLASASKWKTLNGAQKVLNQILNQEQTKKKIKIPNYVLEVVEISQVWNDSIVSQIEHYKDYIEKKIHKLHSQLI